MADEFIIVEENDGKERYFRGLNTAGALIGVFYIDDVIQDALKNPDHFRRKFNSTVCDAADKPGYDLKHPPSADPTPQGYAYPETAPFFVESYRRAARELGLPADCEVPMSALPTPKAPAHFAARKVNGIPHEIG